MKENFANEVRINICYFFTNKNMFHIDIPKMSEFTCLKDGRHQVAFKDAKGFYYQYTSRGGVMARGVCPKHGNNMTNFVSKDKVPSGEKIKAASPSSGKKSNKKSGGKRKSKKSHPSHKKSHSSHKKSHKSHKRSAKK
jgi:hypothetical protein